MGISDDPPEAASASKDLWKVQAAQAVSMIADVSLIWIFLWWLFVHKKESTPSVEDALLAAWPLGTGWLVYALALPLCGLLADRFSRKKLAAVGLLARALVHLFVGVMFLQQRFDAAWAPALHATSMLGGALFDAASLSLVPSIMPPSKKERGVGSALVLPRAGFFISGIVCLLLIAILDISKMALCGALFCTISALLCLRIPGPTLAKKDAPSGGFLRSLFDGPMMILRAPRLLGLLLITGLINFLIYPLYWVTPALHKSGLGSQHDLPSNIEVCLVLGVLVGAWATPRLCKKELMRPEQVVMLSFLLLGVGLVGLGYTQLALQAYLASIVIGFALIQLMGLTGTAALINTPDSHLGRVVALFAMVFEVGGWAGSIFLSPIIHQHGAGPVLSIAAIPLCLFGIFGLLSRRAPSLLV